MQHSNIYRCLKKSFFQVFLFRKKARICWLKSWLFNVLAIGLKDSFKLPIFIYSNVDVISVPHIKILAPLERGMIKIGAINNLSYSRGSVEGNGNIVFGGHARFCAGTKIEIWGTLFVGGGTSFSSNILLRCHDEITIEEHVRVGYYSQISDTDGHYMYNKQTNQIRKCTGTIKIGKATWIGANCRIMKNTSLPSHSIVANSSLVNKDYSDIVPMTIFAGMPARPVKDGYTRIVDDVIENDLHAFFQSHKEIDHIDAHNIISDIDHACQL